MSVFRVRVRVTSPADEALSQEVDMVVDTGATYTVLPAAVWRRLAIPPVRAVRARLANGEFVYRDMGEADVTCGERRTRTWVMLGKDDDVALLGAYALEGLGLEVDPVNEELRTADAYMLSASVTLTA